MEEIGHYDSPLIHRTATEHLNERSDRVQLPERAVAMGYLRWQSGDFSHGGKPFAPRSQRRVAPTRTLENCESHRLHLVENPFGNSACDLRLGFVCGSARDEQRNSLVYFEMGRSSMTWRDDDVESNQFEVLRLRVPRGSCKTNDSIGKECTPETYAYRIMFMGNTFLRRTTPSEKSVLPRRTLTASCSWAS